MYSLYKLQLVQEHFDCLFRGGQRAIIVSECLKKETDVEVVEDQEYLSKWMVNCLSTVFCRLLSLLSLNVLMSCLQGRKIVSVSFLLGDEYPAGR